MDNKKEPIITNETKPNMDLSEEYFSESSKPKRNAVTFIFILVATFSFVALGWYVYKINNTIKSVDELEVIHAENSVTKVMPEDPGGMNVPDMDKSIYDNLSTSGHDKPAKHDKIIPAPEEPKMFDENQTIERSEVVVEEKKTITETKTPEFKEEKESVNIVQKKAPKEDLRKKEKEIKQKLASKKKGVYVQVGSFKNEADATSTWSKLYKKHSNVIGDSYHIERKDLGSKGIFYRLQTGPYKSESEARLVCQKLQACNQSCFLAR